MLFFKFFKIFFIVISVSLFTICTSCNFSKKNETKINIDAINKINDEKIANFLVKTTEINTKLIELYTQYNLEEKSILKKKAISTNLKLIYTAQIEIVKISELKLVTISIINKKKSSEKVSQLTLIENIISQLSTEIKQIYVIKEITNDELILKFEKQFLTKLKLQLNQMITIKNQIKNTNN